MAGASHAATNTLPLWLQYVQAVAVVCIALIGAWIAYRQLEIAAAQLQHDQYERRYRVFDAVRKALATCAVQGTLKSEEVRSFILDTGDAIFLFDDAMAAYLDEIGAHLRKLSSIRLVLQSMLPGEDRNKAINVAQEHADWLDNQIEVLAEKFKPFLRLDQSTLRERLSRMLTRIAATARAVRRSAAVSCALAVARRSRK